MNRPARYIDRLVDIVEASDVQRELTEIIDSLTWVPQLVDTRGAVLWM